MNPLNLFPARVRFTNPDGTLTPDALKALAILLARVGGSNSNGVAPSTDLETIFGAFVSEAPQELAFDIASQSVSVSQQLPEFAQSIQASQEQPNVQLQVPTYQFEDQPVRGQDKRTYLPMQLPTVGASPWTYTATGDCEVVIAAGTISALEYVRQGTAASLVGRGAISLCENDSLRITYTVAPTVSVFPR